MGQKVQLLPLQGSGVGEGSEETLGPPKKPSAEVTMLASATTATCDRS